MPRHDAPALHAGIARSFADDCRRLGVEPPAALVKGLAVLEVAEQIEAAEPAGGLLDLTPDDVRARITELAVRRHQSNTSGVGLRPGVTAFTEQLMPELRRATLPELERIVEELRPLFEERSEPIVVAAQRYGFTLATTSDEVINRADEGASAAWRDLRRAWAAIDPIVKLRLRMSEVFGVSPTRATMPDRVRAFTTHSVNYSVCFAAGDNWSMDDGFVTNEQRTQLDWLALAVGGLRLNSPAEVDAKIASRPKREPGELALIRAQAKREGERAASELAAFSARIPARSAKAG